MIYLPDVNVWIALTSDQHVHHVAAKRWMQNLEADKLSFCRITELGFLRLLTNHHVMGRDALTPAQAWRFTTLSAPIPELFLLRNHPSSAAIGVKPET